MIFRQLFEPVSSTYTYLLGCEATRQAVLIDPVWETVDRDLAVLRGLGLSLAYTLETHVHADHLTGACRLRALTGSRIGMPGVLGLPCADLAVRHGEPIHVGTVELQPLFTPGHTDHHHAYRVDDGTHVMLFTGDALLIDGCGRTDFQSGDAQVLYRSVHDQLFTQPDDSLVYPGHDYHGRRVSTIAQERARNPRLGGGRSLEAFLRIMADLDLPPPARMDVAVPANERCGDCGDDEAARQAALTGRLDQG